MKTKNLKYLELVRTELVEKKLCQHMQSSSTYRQQLEQEIQSINQKIRAEQIALWNYYINTPISDKNLEELCDIVQYFDQLNFEERLYEKILKEMTALSLDYDDCMEEQDFQQANVLKFKLNQLKELMRDIYSSHQARD